MIKIIGFALVMICLPSGIVLAWYLKRYLDIKLKMLEDRRYRESLDDISKM
ncbi:MAG TPA: hypothetical protein VI479_12945 [Blastocatellia bacterium]|jgi:hypothetical protein